MPNEVDGNTDGSDSDMSIRLVPVHFKESAADAIFEVAGLVLTVRSNRVGDVAAGFAGLASAGEESAELQSLLAIETARFSIPGSVVGLGPVVTGQEGGKEGLLVKLPSSIFSGRWSSMDMSSQSVTGITTSLR